jgi:hypothetical protein
MLSLPAGNGLASKVYELAPSFVDLSVLRR